MAEKSEEVGAVYGREMMFAAAYQHEDGALCVQNAATGTWFANDDGRVLYRVRRICEREHPETMQARVEVLPARWENVTADAHPDYFAGLDRAAAELRALLAQVWDET